MTPQPHNTLLYHITHVCNLPNIIKSGGLWCDKKRVGKGFDSTNIAHADIKERRLKIPVPLYSGTTLANYVPFYFCNRSPMLYSIHTGYVTVLRNGLRIYYKRSLISPLCQLNQTGIIER